MDAIDVFAPIVLVRIIRVAAPRWYLSKAFAPAGDGGRSLVAGLLLFLPLTAWLLTGVHFLIFLMFHGSAPARPVIASAANNCLGTCMLVGSSIFFGRRKRDELVDEVVA
jgi:hypothetical protein